MPSELSDGWENPDTGPVLSHSGSSGEACHFLINSKKCRQAFLAGTAATVSLGVFKKQKSKND